MAISDSTTDSGFTIGFSSGAKRKPIPGNGAVWVAILSEMSEFGLMFLFFFLAKTHYPQVFADGPAMLNTTAGMLNTLALLSSSYFVARSVYSIKRDDVRRAIFWMWMAFGAGIAYLIIKYWEYRWNIAHGYEVGTNMFFAAYYYMTFNHFLHVGWGSGALLWGIIRLRNGGYTAENHEGLESIASYWHMIDLAWIIIFPLVYVIQ